MTNEDHEIIATSQKPLIYDEDDYEINETGELVLKKYVGTLTRNPNGASKNLQDPRQELMWKLYIQGLYKGQPNAYKSALKAGYSENTAINICNIKWFKDRKAKLKKGKMKTRAEGNLYRMLKIPFTGIKINEQGEEVEVFDIDKAKLVLDVSKFIAETLGKDEGYSKKIEEDKNISHNIKIESVDYSKVVELPEEAKQPIIDTTTEEIKNE